MNRLSLAKQTQIINCLVEGNSIRSTERMTETHRDTICRLLVEVGDGCQRLMHIKMFDLDCRRVQVDEIWAYVGKKQRHLTAEDDRSQLGDFYTFVAIDSETKLIPSYLVGKRTAANATIFLNDLSRRLSNRVQLSSDGLAAYVDAVEKAFGTEVDYGQQVKFYEDDVTETGRYSPPKVVKSERTPIVGTPDERHISTSIIERQNLTMRMSMRRFTRLTNGFSKKVENLQAAVSLHFAFYNFVRTHKTLRMTPAMAANVVPEQWNMEELVDRATKLVRPAA